jgi:hypothetical protein
LTAQISEITRIAKRKFIFFLTEVNQHQREWAAAQIVKPQLVEQQISHAATLDGLPAEYASTEQQTESQHFDESAILHELELVPGSPSNRKAYLQ